MTDVETTSDYETDYEVGQDNVEVLGMDIHNPVFFLSAGLVLLFAGVVGTMAWGMWNVRYWAVLGFQALLLFSILGSAIGMVNALTWLAFAGNFVLLAGAGALFVFMVKAMARVQMPQRRST